ncbi:MAG: D-tagaturonate epimerase UxaE [Anaerolineales bacterium]
MTNLPKNIYPASQLTHEGTTYFLVKLPTGERRLGLSGDTSGFSGGTPSPSPLPLLSSSPFLLFPLSPSNAATLRTRLPWLNPTPLGTRTSFGFGDRMGAATPGHIHALRATDPRGIIAPIFAQQSVRENTRTGRTPQQVMDDAIWGIFQEGWRTAWGADADHVKEVSDLPAFVQAGYTFYTIDPSDHVDNAAQTDDVETLQAKMTTLPWDILQSSYADMKTRYCEKAIVLDGLTLEFNEAILQRGLAKYGRALAHTLTIANALAAQMSGKPFDLEMSVDETDTPTSVYEHFFIANELARCGAPVVSLAPRFVGKFQKGVDYMGHLAEFEYELARHTAIMRHFGTYKLSIHTGSDKFSLYPIIARHTGNLVHVKTAGTSYLEGLRVVAAHDPALFRKMLGLARARFEKDRKTYFLDAQLSKVPENDALSDADLPGLLDQFDARQVLHVGFGSILEAFGREFQALISRYEAEFSAGLEKHFARHLTPFVS